MADFTRVPVGVFNFHCGFNFDRLQIRRNSFLIACVVFLKVLGDVYLCKSVTGVCWDEALIPRSANCTELRKAVRTDARIDQRLPTFDLSWLINI